MPSERIGPLNDSPPLRVWYFGNFGPPHSTENDLLHTMRSMGVAVTPRQEEDGASWGALLGYLRIGEHPDLILWTRTKSLSDQVSDKLKRSVQIHAALAGVPMVGFHLDRWNKLSREADVYEDPFFRCQYLFTADGHDPAWWRACGVNHVWSPPAIAPHNCVTGIRKPMFISDVAFVGSWHGYGHTEWEHRHQLAEFLRKNYGSRLKMWPRKGEPAIRGQDLADLYTSVKVVVGDSCLTPDGDKPWTRYLSDRVPESLGRGAFLLHPWVGGVTDGSLFAPGEHLDVWTLGDWDELGSKIDHYLSEDEERSRIAKAGFEHVRAYHTYAHRLRRVFEVVGCAEEG